MTFIVAIMAVPLVAGTGLYNPKVTHQGRCLAEPGSIHALFCAHQAPEAPAYRTKRKTR
jgi:hypothetical protein